MRSVLESQQPASGTPMRYPIRGRDDEIERAVDVLRRAADSGQSGVVLLTGEPGIGKTALLGAIAERARELSFSVGLSKAEKLNQIAPLAPLLVALRCGSVPLLSRSDFNELAPLCRQPLWLVDRLTSMLEKRASASPLLIGIDDLQWADPLSVFALRVMPVHLASCPIVWLFTTHPRPAQPANEIRAALAADVAIREMNVGPLAPDAIDELARDRHGDRPRGRLRRQLQGAQGYPFLVVDLLDGISRDDAALTGGDADDARAQAPHNSELPDRLIVGVRSRLETLSDEALRLLQVASIFGRSFLVEDVAELLHVTPWTKLVPSIQAAVDAGVLTDDEDRLAFRHDLLRQAVYQDVPQSMRIGLHRAVAQRALAAGRGALEAAPHVLIYAHRGDRQAIDVLRTANVQRPMQTAGVLRRRWAPARQRPLEGWAALTATEERVARLIAQGHTNRSAAQHLVLSPNTVATHLRSIFGKLAVNSRSQLTRVVMCQPPPQH
jgi:predicted ATPase/DNA-binding CsgD family transcriptional regulator